MMEGWAKWHLNKLTPKLANEIAASFRKGATLKIAAGKAEIPPAVLRAWLQEGERDLTSIYDAETGVPQPETRLYIACAKATAEYLEKHVGNVSDPGKDEWRNSSWLLERRDEDFNPAAKVEVTGADGGPVQIEGRSIVGIADIVRWYVESGNGHLIGIEPPGDALPVAREVLPDRPELERAASVPSDLPGS